MSWRAVFLLCCLGPVPARAQAQSRPLEGPLPARNQHPAQLTVLHLDPRAATTLPGGASSARVDAAYSSLLLSGSGGGNTFVMDGEYLRTRLGFAVGITDAVEFAIELPFGYGSGGFLDSFLIDYHQALGLPDQNRSNLPKDRWHVEATRGGTTVFAVEDDSVELMDLPLSLQWHLLGGREQGLALALRGGFELPTGSDSRGFGNGGVDVGAGALLQWRCDWLGLYGHAQHTFAATPDAARDGGLEFADVTSLGLAAEVRLSDDVSGLAQVEWETSTLRNLGFDRVARDQVTLWIGGRLHLGQGFAGEIAFGEDLVGFVSPDFTAWLGISFRPPGHR
jgi:hypothetical protein